MGLQRRQNAGETWKGGQHCKLLETQRREDSASV